MPAPTPHPLADHPAVSRVRAALAEYGVRPEISYFDESAKTAATLVDEWLGHHEVVWAAAGHAHTVFPTSFGELVRVTAGSPADVGA